MILIGPISSALRLPDVLRAAHVFHADEALFHTGWFVESLCTQTLVLFVIRTYERPWRSRPSNALALRRRRGGARAFLPVLRSLTCWASSAPAPFFAFLAVATLTYLRLVEVVKRALVTRGALGGAA